MDEHCVWPECEEQATTYVEFRPVCAQHEVEQLRVIVRAGPRGMPDDRGRPTDDAWLNKLGRLIEAIADGVGGLGKVKIRDRAFAVDVNLPHVRFSMERHPFGFVKEQRWALNTETNELVCEDEKTLRSDLPLDENGKACCPRCNSDELTVSTGGIRCPCCSYEQFYDHWLS